MKTPVSEVFHEFIEGAGQRFPNLAGQVRIHRSCSGTAMTERVLNQTQMNSSFHQVRCVRVAAMSLTT